MFNRCFFGVIITAALALSACAVPSVDQRAASFDQQTFETDLDACRGGGAAEATVSGLKGAVIGSAIGAAEGASSGAISGDSAEGAIFGTILGAIVGLGVGAYEAVTERETNLSNCLRDKGYDIIEPKETTAT